MARPVTPALELRRAFLWEKYKRECLLPSPRLCGAGVRSPDYSHRASTGVRGRAVGAGRQIYRNVVNMPASR